MAELEYLELTLAAGQSKHQPVSGSYFFVKEATAEFNLRIGNKATIPADTNTEMDREEPFVGLEFINTGEVPVTIKFYYGDGSIKTNGITFAGSLRLEQAATRTSAAVEVGIVAAELLDFNSARKGWKVFNNGDDYIYLGSDDTVTAATGDPVPPKGAAGWDDTAALYAISESAGQDVRITEIV